MMMRWSQITHCTCHARQNRCVRRIAIQYAIKIKQVETNE